MAVVVWVFAGGGEAEVRGLIPFLEKNFPSCQFERKTPARLKPGPKPGKVTGYGKTGKSLIEQITQELPIALQCDPKKCDLILVFDDLDCRDVNSQREKFISAISKITECNDIPQYIAFATPEIESWMIGDWDNTIAKHPDFRSRHEKMRWWLSTQKNISFDDPESFSKYDQDRDCCQDKLSQLIVDSSISLELNFDMQSVRFSKGLHTPLLLLKIVPENLQKKCPLFRELYNYLHDFCNTKMQ
ncbi:MAG: hypothetical protein ACKPCI_26920 [Dolichospermum sp.]